MATRCVQFCEKTHVAVAGQKPVLLTSFGKSFRTSFRTSPWTSFLGHSQEKHVFKGSDRFEEKCVLKDKQQLFQNTKQRS